MLMFAASFIKRDSHHIRNSLWMAYAASLILFIIYLIWFVVTQDVTKFIGRICDGINDAISWSDCTDDISDLLWVFVTIYAALVILVRGFFVRVLYWWYRDSVVENEKYQELSGKAINDDHHHKDHHDHHDHH